MVVAQLVSVSRALLVAFQLLSLVCVIPIERKQSFWTATCSGWEPTTDNPKQF